jgi:hypothetical protein
LPETWSAKETGADDTPLLLLLLSKSSPWPHPEELLELGWVGSGIGEHDDTLSADKGHVELETASSPTSGGLLAGLSIDSSSPKVGLRPYIT